MTELEKEIQELWREKTILAGENEKLKKEKEKLEKENESLRQMHYCDQAEIVYQRRQIDFLMDSGRQT